MIYALIGIPLLAFFSYKWKKSDLYTETPWMMGAIFTLITLFVVFATMAAGHLVGITNVEKYDELRITIEKHGTREDHMEDIFGQVTELNQNLRADKMWNKTVVADPFIYDGWAELEPIELPE